MLDRESELDAMKRLDLGVIAAAHGFVIERKRSTRHTVMMSNGQDKIAISNNGRHYVFWSVGDDRCNGTAIDFAQKVIEPGCNLGRARQLLRPFLGAGYMGTMRQQYEGRYAPDIKPSEFDLAGVAARYEQFTPIAQPHHYLCNVRGIPFELLTSLRLQDRLRHDPRRGSIIFPHYGSATDDPHGERSLVGYEIKSNSVNMYSKGGKKGLWMSNGLKGDTRLAIAESGLDALSYLVARGETGTRVASISGKMNPSQPVLITAAIDKMQEGAQVIAAFDNDAGGDDLATELQELVAKHPRKDIEFVDDRPLTRSYDWNKVVVDEAKRLGKVRSLGQSFGR